MPSSYLVEHDPEREDVGPLRRDDVQTRLPNSLISSGAMYRMVPPPTGRLPFLNIRRAVSRWLFASTFRKAASRSAGLMSAIGLAPKSGNMSDMSQRDLPIVTAARPSRAIRSRYSFATIAKVFLAASAVAAAPVLRASPGSMPAASWARASSPAAALP